MSKRRIRLTITGQVQGVGFRPFIYGLAHEFKLTGSVLNAPEGVIIEIQGEPANIDALLHGLQTRLPPLARIVSCQQESIPPLDGDNAFVILQSTQGKGHHVLISPDVATCADCLQDIFDPDNRRHLYPFTNCTNCGPRYTITRSIPYDRDKTSMACFPLCPQCDQEYRDPLNRRFHAQPNACPQCGPHVWLTDGIKERICPDPLALRETARLLFEGKIIAIKGLGGFHLACDATSTTSVNQLKTRKNRWGKPLAIMVPDLETAQTVCTVSDKDRELLSGHIRPIVVMPRRPASALARELSPDTDFLGVMLPYTPLHHILLHHYAQLCGPSRIPALVMTSGNLSSEPICLGNREALSRLAAIADYFLLHNRDILIRCDDSVVRHNQKTPQFLRRARGYTPGPIFLAQSGPCVLGVGPELKNTLCLTKENQAFVSQHIGDMENLETFEFFKEIAAHLQDILQVVPKAVVRDLHPDYLSSRFADQYKDIPVFSLQHHFAHIHAVLAENRFQGRALGLALDGTGLGTDGTLWGGELLAVDTHTLDHHRTGRFDHLRLPGGEAAIKEPWRIARSMLCDLGIQAPGSRDWPWLKPFARQDAFIPHMLAKQINTPVSSSCGRLFDGVAALLGLKLTIAYEGQAAIMLEAIQDRGEHTGYACSVREQDGMLVLGTRELFAQVVGDWEKGIDAGIISRRFHLGLMHGLAAWADQGAQQQGVSTIGLSGGVMQNQTLSLELPPLLEQKGLTVLVHNHLPPNDGCISLGQAVYGRQQLRMDA
ncbi:carbamoyltransferase HypF [Desulfoplanes formicivorans]|uniref:Carbamoyltransferase n=1 Tax=Desulfoplanes formicivorans TaxID=1592317 RepID=A0A194AJQ0_9BACT|nr:carbamoyltransferase HypF [Desulfoplanes formicivorans]GAU09281.1 hydrogenase maturation protein HypF [Desulfoplanes formicivorans]